MLKIELDDQHRLKRVIGTGTIRDMTYDLSLAIRAIHAKIRSVNPDEAWALKTALQLILRDDSPVWEEAPDGQGYIVTVPARPGSPS